MVAGVGGREPNWSHAGSDNPPRYFALTFMQRVESCLAAPGIASGSRPWCCVGQATGEGQGGDRGDGEGGGAKGLCREVSVGSGSYLSYRGSRKTNSYRSAFRGWFGQTSALALRGPGPGRSATHGSRGASVFGSRVRDDAAAQLADPPDPASAPNYGAGVRESIRGRGTQPASVSRTLGGLRPDGLRPEGYIFDIPLQWVTSRSYDARKRRWR